MSAATVCHQNQAIARWTVTAMLRFDKGTLTGEPSARSLGCRESPSAAGQQQTTKDVHINLDEASTSQQ